MLSGGNFEMVTGWHMQFGHSVQTEFKAFPDQQTIDLAVDLIEEEWNELKSAIAARDFEKVLDGLGDTLWTVYGLAARFGIDADSVLDAVGASNFSKGYYSEEEAKAGAELRSAEEGEEIVAEQGMPGFWVLKRTRDGKIRKGHNFAEPKFDEKCYALEHSYEELVNA